MVVGLSPVAVISDIAPVLSKEFLDIRAIIEGGFTLKHERDMIRTYSQLEPKVSLSKKYLKLDKESYR